MNEIKNTPSKFDPSEAISSEYGIFGLPITEQEASVVLLPIPWEVTTSYGRGAADGPILVRNASEQVDLFDLETGKAYEKGFFMRDYPEELRKKNDLFKQKAQKIIELRTNRAGHTEDHEKEILKLTLEVNTACQEMNEWVYQQTLEILRSGKKFGLVGGDHSTPFGAIRAFCEHFSSDFGILHIDAHADLRIAYQGFTFSHASIMNNVMTLPNPPRKLVQVGIRDFSEEEHALSESRSDIKTFFDLNLKRDQMKGKSWDLQTQEILNELPQNVYISFDIDGLNPVNCPHTGTPVPGGLSIEEIFYLFRALHDSGRNLIGFDLNEVSSGGNPLETAEWDGNVGARILYKLCSWLALSKNYLASYQR